MMFINNNNSLCIFTNISYFLNFMNLWSTFPTLSPNEWKDKIVQDLRGKPFSDIIWKTSYGELDPTEIPNHTISSSFNRTNEFCWELIESENINSAILNILKNGANSVSLKTFHLTMRFSIM